MQRLEAIEAYIASNRLPDPRPGQSDRNMAKTIMDMEIYVNSLINNPPIQKEEANAIIEDKIKM